MADAEHLQGFKTRHVLNKAYIWPNSILLHQGGRAWNEWLYHQHEDITLDFREANLSGLDLRGADLQGADLSYADCSGADLTGVKLGAADLHRANFAGADFSNVL